MTPEDDIVASPALTPALEEAVGPVPEEAASQAIVDGFTALYVAGDVDGAVDRYIAEDCTYTLHIDATSAPFGGTTQGRETIRAVLHTYREDFEYILYAPRTLGADGGTVRQQLQFIYRHYESGERLSGSARLVWTVADGRILRCDEYQDAAMLEAFFRQFSSRGPKLPPT